MQTTSLLTLTGVGGSGKTRLAIRIAETLEETFPDGVRLLELAALSDPAQVPQALGALFGVVARPDIPLHRTLLDMLASRRMLLILDNGEHLLAACAQLASDLLRFCPDVRLLVTSRERLGIAGEQVYRLSSLPLPDSEQPAAVENLSRCDAVRLFVERARSVKSDFYLTDRNAPALAALCRRVDGNPLALELAAARVCTLSVEDIVVGLEERFDLLSDGDRSAPPRHRTLRALFDWSYDLLDPQEKRLLQRLSVFPGGWTLKAAEYVCGEGGLEVRKLLTSLTDKSLVVTEEREGTVRYRLFATLRQYAADRLHTSGERAAIFLRRYIWYLTLVEEAVQYQASGREEKPWMPLPEAEQENLRATLAWDSGEEEDQGGLRLAALLWRLRSDRGYEREGESFSETPWL